MADALRISAVTARESDDEEIRANVLELLGALTRWIRSGGFPPTIDNQVLIR